MHPVAEALPCAHGEAADAPGACEQAQRGRRGACEEPRVGRGHLAQDRERPCRVAACVEGAGEEGADEPSHLRAVGRVVVEPRLVGDEDELVIGGDAGAVDGDDLRVEAAQLQLDALDVAVDAEYGVDAVCEQCG